MLNKGLFRFKLAEFGAIESKADDRIQNVQQEWYGFCDTFNRVLSSTDKNKNKLLWNQWAAFRLKLHSLTLQLTEDPTTRFKVMDGFTRLMTDIIGGETVTQEDKLSHLARSVERSFERIEGCEKVNRDMLGVLRNIEDAIRAQPVVTTSPNNGMTIGVEFNDEPDGGLDDGLVDQGEVEEFLQGVDESLDVIRGELSNLDIWVHEFRQEHDIQRDDE